MKKIFLYGTLALMTVALASCNDFLEENRYPLTSQSNSPDFWNNSANIETMENTFYNQFTGYGSGGGYGLFYFRTLSDDQGAHSFANWKYTNVPASDSSWSDAFSEIRRSNYIINNVRTSTLVEGEKTKFEGIARLMRAWQYFRLVREYGDVQWINVVVDPEDDETVYGARDDRDMVMDSVLADLNYACATIGDGTQITWSNDMAQAMKSDICLWEGTYCKYRTLSDNGKGPDASRAQKFLNECVTASEKIIDGGKYSIDADYREVYNSSSLDGNGEAIFYKSYRDNVQMHSLIAYTLSSTPVDGPNKSAFDAYLFRDGKPAGLTSYDDTDVASISSDIQYDDDGKPLLAEYSIKALLDVRDDRLAQTTDSVLYFTTTTGNYQSQTWSRDGGAAMTSATGYGVRKYDNASLEDNCRKMTARCYTDAPIFWYPVVLCNFAEAKAELGTITSSDLDKSINLLFARALLPNMTASVGFTDPKNDVGVSDIIWETRRCRRCELIMDNDFRYWDLIRWHMLDKLDTNLNPDINLGANLSEFPAYVEAYNAAIEIYNQRTDIPQTLYPYTVPTMSGNYMSQCQTVNPGLSRDYESKHYFYPIPSNQLTLNPNLTQNPGW